jgi:hypothetical protein
VVILVRICNSRGLQVQTSRINVPSLSTNANNRAIENPISKRKTDYLGRPTRIESLQRIIDSTKDLIKTNRDFAAPATRDEDDLDDEPPVPVRPIFVFDPQSLESLDAIVTEVENWFSEKLAAQEKLQLWEEPVLRLRDLEMKSNRVQIAIRKIVLEQAKAKTSSKKASTFTSSSSAVVSEATAEERLTVTKVVDERTADTISVPDETASSNVESETGTSGKGIHEEL